MKKIRKAVLPVAGLGTRVLPATKSIPKEIKSLNWLTELNLDSNQISKIENLPESLTVLYLRSNQISKL